MVKCTSGSISVMSGSTQEAGSLILSLPHAKSAYFEIPVVETLAHKVTVGQLIFFKTRHTHTGDLATH